MKKLLFPVVLLASLFLVSCQKEVDDIFANSGGSTAGTGLLTKAVNKSGSDSSVITFGYNNSKKLITINETDDTAGTSGFINQTIIRNSSGIIQQLITKESDLIQYGIDSVLTIVHYDASASRYTSKVFSLNVFGLSIKDSLVFDYDASGKIVGQEDYQDDGSGNLAKSSTIVYTYAGSNLGSLKGYDYSSGSPTLDLTETYQYDTKVSPLIIGNEAFVINNASQWYSANNLSSVVANLTGDPQIHNETITYTYNSANKPASATVVADGQQSRTTFFYN